MEVCEIHDTVVGKRYNALRKHVDTYSYDVDQLLLGTFLFTLLTFSFPTLAVYVALFALVVSITRSRCSTRSRQLQANLFIVILASAACALLYAMNEFPLFALLLRVKDPRRLPGMTIFPFVY